MLPKRFSRVWSAAPTPLIPGPKVDVASVERMVEHHLRLGVKGLFLAGSCGEGNLLPPAEKRRLVRSVARAAAGRLFIAVQVTDDSPRRIVENTEQARTDGADLAVIGPPARVEPGPFERLGPFYLEAVRRSSLPVGLYDLGDRRAHSIPADRLADLYREPRVRFVKDSSSDPARREIALRARAERDDLSLFNGDEFNCAKYLQAGYDGLMLGGGVFNGYLAGMIVSAVDERDRERAERLQERMTRMMHAVYGGPEIHCWLSGLKYLLQQLGVFSTRVTLSEYPLTDRCRDEIARVLEIERDLLLPANGRVGVS